jgi:hypothetical protein
VAGSRNLITQSIKSVRTHENTVYLSLPGVYPMLTRIGLVASCVVARYYVLSSAVEGKSVDRTTNQKLKVPGQSLRMRDVYLPIQRRIRKYTPQLLATRQYFSRQRSMNGQLTSQSTRLTHIKIFTFGLRKACDCKFFRNPSFSDRERSNSRRVCFLLCHILRGPQDEERRWEKQLSTASRRRGE